jgi:aquaporin Z
MIHASGKGRSPRAWLPTRLAAEALGTFFLVFAATGAVAVNAVTLGALGSVGMALACGLAVFTLIEALGDISGAHFNPAVSVAFALAGRFPWRRVPGYVVAQFAGAFAASFMVRALLPASPTLGEHSPHIPASRAFALECLLGLFLMMTILGVTAKAKERGLQAGLAIGAAVFLGVLVAGPVSGGSMNPARSIAPAVVGGRTEDLWIYAIAPGLGAAVAGIGSGIAKARASRDNRDATANEP